MRFEKIRGNPLKRMSARLQPRAVNAFPFDCKSRRCELFRHGRSVFARAERGRGAHLLKEVFLSAAGRALI